LALETLFEEAPVLSMAKLLAEVTSGARFGVLLGLELLLLRGGRGGGWNIGNKDRG